MYPFIKVKKETSVKFFSIMVSLLVLLSFIWWFLTSLQTQLNCFIVVNNTSLVMEDNTKVKVDYINKDNTLYLDDTSKIDGDTIDEYIATTKGTGTYYIPDNKMSRELTWNESIEIGKSWMILTVSIYLISILLLINCRGLKIKSILVNILMFFVSLVTLVVGEYFISNILEKDIYFQEIIVVVYMIFALASVLLRVFRNKIWKSV